VTRAEVVCVLAVLTGCQTEPDYSQVRRDCDVEIAGWEPALSAVELADTLGAECAAALGDSIGLDWDSFGFEPANVRGSETGAYVLTGLLTLAASDEETLSDLLDDADLPELARARLEDLSSESALEGTSPAAEAWFGLVHGAIQTATFSEVVQGGAAAEYSAEEQSVVFAPALLGWERTLSGAPSPAAATTAITHEAAHSFTEVHSPCSLVETRDCDASINGAYGVGIWWLHAWLRAYGAELSGSECNELDLVKYASCGHIEETEGWAPCDDTCR